MDNFDYSDRGIINIDIKSFVTSIVTSQAPLADVYTRELRLAANNNQTKQKQMTKKEAKAARVNQTNQPIKNLQQKTKQPKNKQNAHQPKKPQNANQKPKNKQPNQSEEATYVIQLEADSAQNDEKNEKKRPREATDNENPKKQRKRPGRKKKTRDAEGGQQDQGKKQKATNEAEGGPSKKQAKKERKEQQRQEQEAMRQDVFSLFLEDQSFT